MNHKEICFDQGVLDFPVNNSVSPQIGKPAYPHILLVDAWTL